MISRTPGRMWSISAVTYSFLFLFPQLLKFLFIHNTYLVQYSRIIKVK